MEQLEGKNFGNLEVVEYDKEKKKWKCQCSCGNITYVATRNLKTGNTKSCGCMKNAVGTKRPRKHILEDLLYKDVGQLRITNINKENNTVYCFCLECNKQTIELSMDKVLEMIKSRKKSFTCEIDGCTHTRKTKTNRTSNSIKENERFGQLTVKKRLDNKVLKTNKSFSSIPMFLCQCDCGKQIEVQGRYLINGNTKSCGCQRNKGLKKSVSYKHITSTEDGKILYDIYKNWKLKFSKPSKAFKTNVIDRGIKFFPELEESEAPFVFFYQWAILNGFNKDKRYLERTNYLKDFSAKNCYWVSNKTRGY